MNNPYKEGLLSKCQWGAYDHPHHFSPGRHHHPAGGRHSQRGERATAGRRGRGRCHPPRGRAAAAG